MWVRDLLSVAVWVIVGAGLRLAALPPVLGDLDAANFAEALERFDPAQQAPHWPGYPVYVAAARALYALGLTPTHALGLVGVMGFVAAAPVFYAGLADRFGRATAHSLTAAVSLAPGAVVSAAWSGTEGLGLALLLAEVGWALRRPRRDFRVALVAGLGLGVRLSWWPLFLGVLVATPRASRRVVSAGLLAGLAVWLVPLGLVVDPSSLVEPFEFAAGHFTTWGGAVTAEASLSARLIATASSVVAGFGGVVPFAAVLGAALIALWDPRARSRVPALALPCGVVGVYGVWIYLAQNVARPRHALPIAVALLLAAAFVAHASRRRILIPVGAVLLVASTSFARLQGGSPAPAAQAAAYIRDRAAVEPVQVFAGRQGRLVERLVPGVRLWRPADADVLLREAAAADRRGATVLVLDDTAAFDRLPTTEAAVFEGPRALRGPDARVVVYRYSSEANRVASR